MAGEVSAAGLELSGYIYFPGALRPNPPDVLLVYLQCAGESADAEASLGGQF